MNGSAPSGRSVLGAVACLVVALRQVLPLEVASVCVRLRPTVSTSSWTLARLSVCVQICLDGMKHTFQQEEDRGIAWVTGR